MVKPIQLNIYYNFKITIMKKIKLLGLAFILFNISCNQSSNETQDSNTNPNAPGPVTEVDKNRYNLNPNDEVVYGTADTINQDSLSVDTTK